MKRLTERDVFAELAIKDMVPIDMRKLSAMYHKLRLYEDTGITPEEFEIINQEYTRMARELSILHGKNRWIPCSERLPDEEQSIWISIILTNGNTDSIEGVFTNGELCATSGAILSGIARAWMPRRIPDPYRE